MYDCDKVDVAHHVEVFLLYECHKFGHFSGVVGNDVLLNVVFLTSLFRTEIEVVAYSSHKRELYVGSHTLYTGNALAVKVAFHNRQSGVALYGEIRCQSIAADVTEMSFSGKVGVLEHMPIVRITNPVRELLRIVFRYAYAYIETGIDNVLERAVYLDSVVFFHI